MSEMIDGLTRPTLKEKIEVGEKIFENIKIEEIQKMILGITRGFKTQSEIVGDNIEGAIGTLKTLDGTLQVSSWIVENQFNTLKGGNRGNNELITQVQEILRAKIQQFNSHSI